MGTPRSRRPILGLVFWGSLLAIAGLVPAVLIGGQAAEGRAAPGRAGAEEPWNPPRTPDGQPDIQGTYTKVGLVNGGRGVFEEENPALLQPCPGGVAGCPSYDREIWGRLPSWGSLPRELKITLPMGIIDPPDGKPPLRPAAAARKERFKKHQADPDRLEYVDTQTRCLHTGVPRSVWTIGYLGYQIIQGPGHVVLFSEYGQMRFISLERRSPLGPSIRLFGGDSQGRWEGNTLIVETTNLAVPGATGFGVLDQQGTPISEAARLVERYTSVDPDVIAVEVTVDDPKMYTQPWTAAGAYVRAPKEYQLFEYACHEGNYGMENLSFRVPRKR